MLASIISDGNLSFFTFTVFYATYMSGTLRIVQDNFVCDFSAILLQKCLYDIMYIMIAIYLKKIYKCILESRY